MSLLWRVFAVNAAVLVVATVALAVSPATVSFRWVKGTRWSLLKAPEHQTISQLATLWEVQQANRRFYRAFLLREELRLLYTCPTRRSPRRISVPGSGGQPGRA